MIAARADRGGLYLGRHDACLLKLSAADGPEIEMSGPDLVGMKLLRQFGMKIKKLSAAWPQGRADGGHDLRRVRAEIRRHLPNSFGDDIGHTAPPASMDIGHDPIKRVIENHGLTIGLLDQESDSRLIGDQCIVALMLAIT